MAGEPLLGHADAHGGGRLRRAGDAAVVPAGEDLVDEGRVGHRSGQRAGNVLAGADRDDLLGRHGPDRRLQPDDAVQRGRAGDGPVGLGADRHRGQSGATAAPEPEEDPPALRSRAHGFPVRPPTPDQPLTECGDRKLAHSDRLVEPRITAPASRRRATTGASAVRCVRRGPGSPRCPAGRPPRCCPSPAPARRAAGPRSRPRPALPIALVRHGLGILGGCQHRPQRRSGSPVRPRPRSATAAPG